MQFWRLAMINPSQLNLSSLPSVPLCDRKQLPATSGIYFALSGGTVQYIGRSVNIRQRWADHHQTGELEKAGNVRIAYLAVSDPALLPAIETALIEFFNPPLNQCSWGGGYQGHLGVRRGALVNKIKEFVDGLGISVYEFRKRTGIAQRTAYDLYNTPFQIPSSSVLTKICDTFRIPPGEILDWVPPEERPSKSQTKKRATKGKTPDD